MLHWRRCIAALRPSWCRQKTTFAQGRGGAGHYRIHHCLLHSPLPANLTGLSPTALRLIWCMWIAYRLGGSSLCAGQDAIGRLVGRAGIPLGLDEELEDPGENTVVPYGVGRTNGHRPWHQNDLKSISIDLSIPPMSHPAGSDGELHQQRHSYRRIRPSRQAMGRVLTCNKPCAHRLSMYTSRGFTTREGFMVARW